jgi:hypothetical protein
LHTNENKIFFRKTSPYANSLTGTSSKDNNEEILKMFISTSNNKFNRVINNIKEFQGGKLNLMKKYIYFLNIYFTNAIFK